MSTGDVHQNDMPTFPDDQWPADDPAFAAFAEDLRIIAAGPAPEPRPGLVAVMRQGAVPIQSPAGRSKRMLVKTFVGGLAAKVALGMGVATASVTAAGAAGVLPEPARDVVASVVAAATPFQLPDPSLNLQVGGGDLSSTSSSSSTSTTLAEDDGEGSDGTTERKANHGACVSAAARDKAETQTGGEPNSHGKTVSSIARSDCGKEEKGSTSSTTSTTVGSSSTSSSSTSTTVAGSQRSANSGPGNSGNSGKGNPGNSGNSGKGNPGNSGKN